MRCRYLFPLLGLLVAIILVLTGCGAATPSGGDRVVADGSFPTIVSRSPAPGESDVFLRVPLQVTFSEPMDGSSIDASSVIVTGKGDIVLGTTSALSEDQTGLSIDFISSPNVPDDLTVTLTSAISDLEGNQLILPADDWSFSAPPWLAVGESISAEAGATNSFDPSIAVDGSGNIFIAWQEAGGASTDIHVRRWDGATWSDLGERLHANDGSTAASSPSLALDSSGNPTVAWAEWDGSNSNIHVHSWDGNSWNPLGGALSANSEDGGADNPSLAIDDFGNPFVAWDEKGAGEVVHNIYVRSWDGIDWNAVGGAVSASSEVGSTAQEPSLAVDDLGHPYVAWYELDGSGAYRPNVSSWDGNSWNPLVGGLSANANTSSFNPSLTLDGLGNPFVVWHENDPVDGASNIYVRRWTGSAWEPIGGGELSVTPGATDADGAVLSVDESGYPVVAWREQDSSFFVNVYVQRWNGSDWELLGGPLSANPGSTPVLAPSLALDEFGQPVVAWREFGSTSYEVYVQRFNQ